MQASHLPAQVPELPFPGRGPTCPSHLWRSLSVAPSRLVPCPSLPSLKTKTAAAGLCGHGPPTAWSATPESGCEAWWACVGFCFVLEVGSVSNREILSFPGGRRSRWQVHTRIVLCCCLTSKNNETIPPFLLPCLDEE